MAGPPPIPLLGASSKPKKDEKTYIFDLSIGESNEETYPEFSWKDLVAAEQSKVRMASSGKTLLDPYASDDEDNLKAMAAKFEKKYKTSHSSKRKRRAEDYIDRGAGYDETDSFIDNSDVYDEVVPADLETVKGGFYINSGSLDFKEVEVSEEEDEEPAEDEATTKENGKSSNGNSEKKSSVLIPKKTSLSKTKSEHHGIMKPKGSHKSSVVTNPVAKITSQIEVVPKKPSENDISSSSASSSESSTDASSSSSSDSSSSDDDHDDVQDFKEDKPKKQVYSTEVKKHNQPQRVTTPSTTTATMTLNTPDAPPVKRLKTKNVPPNPNLPKNKIVNKVPPCLVAVNSSKDMIVTSTSTPSPKLINRPIQTVTPITSVSSLGLSLHAISASNIKVPTPKTTPTSHSTTPTNNATNLMGLNLVKQHGLVVPKQKSTKSKMTTNSLLSDPALLQTTLNMVNPFSSQSTSVVQETSKKKPKLTKVTPNNSKNFLASKQQALQQRPPKLKAKPRLKQMVPINSPSSMQNTSSPSQSTPFSRPSQQPSPVSQRVEITKIKPAHANSSPSAHHQLTTSIKSLSNLGTGIFPVTVTEVKDKVDRISSSSSSSAFVTGGTTSSPRSRSPNVVGSVASHSNSNNNVNSMSSSRLPPSLTITPSPLLNITSTSGPSCSSAGINLSNIMSTMPTISRGNSLLFGQQQLTTSSSGFSMNNILGKEFPPPTPLSKDFFDQNIIASMAYNMNMTRDTNKK